MPREQKQIVSLVIWGYLDKEPKEVRGQTVLHIWKKNVLGRGDREYKVLRCSYVCVF